MTNPGPREGSFLPFSREIIKHKEAMTFIQVMVHEALLLRETLFQNEISGEVGESHYHPELARRVP